jgi:hypothetical protein
MTTEAPAQEAAQVVLQNVAELAQRQQARELGSSLARQVFRLVKVAQFHALDNMAFLQQLDQTIEALGVFGAQTGEPLSLLFSKSTVFVNGQLLKASRAEYEAALELSNMVRALGVTQVTIQTDASRTDLKAFARLFQPGAKAKAENGLLEPSPHVRLRYVRAARLDENENELSPEDQVLRTYATAVVVMRRVYENLSEGRYQLPNQAKRLAQRLVVLSEGDTPAFLGVTGMRNLNHDSAGRAVNRAILAVSMGRQLTSDLATLSRIAMSALFFDVATPLVTGTVGIGNQVVVAQMTEQAERRLPAATAVVLTALGQVREASMVRTVVAFEAHWMRQLDGLGPLYDGAQRPMVAARIVATANRFNELVEPDLAASHTPSVDEAIAQLRTEAREALDHAMLVLLVGALGVFPRGSPVELSTGEKAVVVHTPDNPAEYVRPTVRLVTDAQGNTLRGKIILDLSQDPERQVVHVIAEPDAVLREACAAVHGVAAQPVASRPAAPAVEPPIAEEPVASPRRPPPVPTRASDPEPSSGQRRLSSAPGSGQRRLSSAPGSGGRPSVEAPPISVVPGSVPPMSSRSLGAVEVVHAPPSRRDPRSDDFDDGDAVSEPTQPSLDWRRRAASLPPREQSKSGGLFATTLSPSASGTFERTPLSHLMLYIMDRSLSGSLVLSPGSPEEGDPSKEHAVLFQDGLPKKVHVEARVAPLGPMLVAHGVLEQSQLENDPISQPPLHEATLESEVIDLGLVRSEHIVPVRNDQIGQRLTWLFSLPSATRYAFYNGVDLLEPVWGSVPGTFSPCAALTSGLREHPETEAMDRVLRPAAESPLQMRDGSRVDEFEFSEDEIGIVVAIATGTPTMQELEDAGNDREVVRRVVYELMLARAVAPLGAAK